MSALPLLRVGWMPVATIAIGVVPNGVFAIGVIPRGVVSIGVVAFGSFAAVGLLAVAPLADGLVFALAAVAFTHRYAHDVFAGPRLASPPLGVPLLVTLAILAAAFAAWRIVLRARRLGPALSSFVATAAAGDAEDLLVDDVAIEAERLQITSGKTRVSASVSPDVRATARARGRHTTQLLRLRKDELRDDDEGVDFRHAPVARIAFTALDLRTPGDAPQLALAKLHLLAAALAFTATLAAILSYLASAP